ncbi:hypothetical protein [Polyangium aurulentum]|uniref:hypothetical protein n=1 Tax=Polyangium aurulentum TaxID=2567896 RepID=UPI0010AE0489|nr:hypothetical protein [Polyangium aurulentum]UQA62421.1 hypothetical protein E8A73_018970 [Polyangium aurulentum]
MAHPYRTRPTLPPVEPDDDARLGGPTLAFGFLCVVSGIALAGTSRPGVVLLAGGAGTVAIAARRGMRRAEPRHIHERRATGTDNRQG